jgi:hypothetical protein
MNTLGNVNLRVCGAIFGNQQKEKYQEMERDKEEMKLDLGATTRLGFPRTLTDFSARMALGVRLLKCPWNVKVVDFLSISELNEKRPVSR